MKTLHISVKDKIATYQKRDGDIVCGNSDYQIEFTFDSEWSAEDTKTARFIWGGQYFDQEFTGTTCAVPVIRNASKVEVGVYAGDLETTTSAEIGCLESILCKGGAPHPESGQHYTAEAVAAAEAAKASEDKAKVSETNAKQSESNASSYASTASVHASNAAKSATAAETSATNALQSEHNAFNSEVNAYVSAQEAKYVSEEIVSRVDRNDKRITNLEQGIIPEPFETDSSVAYVKDVPENALPYAEIAKVGGMTHKCNNLCKGFRLKDGQTTVYISGAITVKPNTDYTVYFPYVNGMTNIYVTGIQTAKIITQASGITGDTTRTFNTGSNTSIELQINTSSSVDVASFKVMLNEGATALPYEPYYEGLRDSAVTEIKSVGANLIPFPYAENNITVNGITFTVNADGSINISGTASDYASFYFVSASNRNPIKAGTYTISINGSNDVIFIIGITGLGLEVNAAQGSDKVFTISSDTTYYIRVRVNAGATVNATVYPMLNKGTTALPYAPYVKHTLPIPEAVQALDGYGWGINAVCYNYVGWEKKQFVKRVGMVDMGTLSWNYSPSYSRFSALIPSDIVKKSYLENYSVCTLEYSSSVYYDAGRTNGYCISNGSVFVRNSAYTDVATFKAAMSGVMLYYELETPEVTDITDLITPDNFIKVEGGGIITAVNEHNQAVPTEITYMIREVAV